MEDYYVISAVANKGNKCGVWDFLQGKKVYACPHASDTEYYGINWDTNFFNALRFNNQSNAIDYLYSKDGRLTKMSDGSLSRPLFLSIIFGNSDISNTILIEKVSTNISEGLKIEEKDIIAKEDKDNFEKIICNKDEWDDLIYFCVNGNDSPDSHIEYAVLGYFIYLSKMKNIDEGYKKLIINWLHSYSADIRNALNIIEFEWIPCGIYKNQDKPYYVNVYWSNRK